MDHYEIIATLKPSEPILDADSWMLDNSENSSFSLSSIQHLFASSNAIVISHTRRFESELRYSC